MTWPFFETTMGMRMDNECHGHGRDDEGRMISIVFHSWLWFSCRSLGLAT